MKNYPMEKLMYFGNGSTNSS